MKVAIKILEKDKIKEIADVERYFKSCLESHERFT